MNSCRLQPHPGTPDERVNGIEVRVTAGSGTLRLRYRLHGDLRRIRVPPASRAGRADGLWVHTCFEVFVHAGTAPRYLELNFSPSGQWAAYRFSGYRDGGQTFELEEPPRIAVRCEGGAGRDGVLELEASVRFAMLTSTVGRKLHLGLCAVVEDDAGGLSYWALRHAAGRPDFHHPETFALELPCPWTATGSHAVP